MKYYLQTWNLEKKIEEFTEYVKTTGVLPEREISEDIS